MINYCRVLFVCLLGSGSLLCMENWQKLQQNAKENPRNLRPIEKKPVQVNPLAAMMGGGQQAKGPFPITDADFRNMNFDDFLTEAYNGKLESIKKFNTNHNVLMNHQDEKGNSLVAFAAYGYVNGEDSWSTFAYLVNCDVPRSVSFMRWLQPLSEEEMAEKYPKDDEKITALEREGRKTQLRLVLEEKVAFIAQDDNPFFTAPENPPTLPIKEEEESFFMSVAKSTGLGVLGFGVAYYFQSKRLQAEANEKKLGRK